MGCKLLCWPPIPSHVVGKLAFGPPEPPSYTFVGDEGAMTVMLRLESGEQMPFLHNRCTITPLMLRTTRNGKHQVAAVHIEPTVARLTLLYSHGNAVDVGQMLPQLAELAEQLQCAIFVYDYPGYGQSADVPPRESQLYSSVEAAWDCLRSRFGVPANKIVFYGQSIGSAPSVHMAAKLGKKLKKVGVTGGERYAAGGMVLHAGLSSGIRVIRPKTDCTWCCDPFQNIDKIHNVIAPTLVIHGTEDEIVPITHGYELHSKCESAVEPLFLESAGHNDVGLFPQYLPRVQSFVNELCESQVDHADFP